MPHRRKGEKPRSPSRGLPQRLGAGVFEAGEVPSGLAFE